MCGVGETERSELTIYATGTSEPCSAAMTCSGAGESIFSDVAHSHFGSGACLTSVDPAYICLQCPLIIRSITNYQIAARTGIAPCIQIQTPNADMKMLMGPEVWWLSWLGFRRRVRGRTVVWCVTSTVFALARWCCIGKNLARKAGSLCRLVYRCDGEKCGPSLVRRRASYLSGSLSALWFGFSGWTVAFYVIF